ncbi:unnamed protein product [Heligmosomoides polygyrus]|uniref:Uncharacterized protein n=1 Tax=Heligmosomoides polygyrus TaxID=6339 RepID=A0A3P7XUJ6_HELPZ|nr:unnamed protein product [Heligmosomoides polygyrus]
MPFPISEGFGFTVTLTDVNGETKTISFPGCYRVKLSFKMRQPIQNPYIEAFLQLGQNIQCRAEGRSSSVSNICTNITRTNWCPQSVNDQLRGMLANKETCTKLYLPVDLLIGIDLISFKMCTPSRRELSEKHGDDRDKLEEYWNYLKQGVMTAVVHVMDRSELDVNRRQQCQRMCNTLNQYVDRSKNSASTNTLLKSIESLCTPRDDYAACVYHTVKFDINGDF